MRIILTHAPGRFEGLETGLRRRGHTVVHAPLITTRPRTGEEVRAAAEALLSLPWLLFTSRSAVEAWSALGVGWQAPGGRSPGAPRVGAVGRKTASALRAAGAEPALVAERASRATGLADAFLQHPEAASPVGLPQGDRALSTLRRALEQAGFDTRPLVLYETVTQPWTGDAAGSGVAASGVPASDAASDAAGDAAGDEAGDAAGDGATPGPELVVLASPSAVDALPGEVAERAALVAIGPTTAAALERRGLACRQARAPSVGGVLDAIAAVAAEHAGVDASEDGAEDAGVDAGVDASGEAALNAAGLDTAGLDTANAGRDEARAARAVDGGRHAGRRRDGHGDGREGGSA